MQLGVKSAQDPRQGHQPSISAHEERSEGKKRATHWVSNTLTHIGAEELSMGTYSVINGTNDNTSLMIFCRNKKLQENFK